MNHPPHPKDLHHRYVLDTYSPSILLTRGEGPWLWDEDERAYLDFGSGISVCNLGHCHPAVTKAIREQADRLLHVSNLFYNELQPRLAHEISTRSFGGKLFFCNSGAEANEGLIKFARRWGSEDGRYEIITMENSFHGRSLATLAATGQKKFRKGFQPDLEGFRHVPFNDIDAVQSAITEKTVAVLVEPVQGEGGVYPATNSFMKGLRELCDQHNLLLLMDEVQSGMGRTGKHFAYQHYDITPDGMALAKSLGNGVPIGAFEVANKYHEVLPAGSHASTFGGNLLACAASLAVFETFDQKNVLDHCCKIGERLQKRLKDMREEGAPIKDIRGMGLMWGADLDVPVKDVLAEARTEGLILLAAGENTLRLMPPLTISTSELDEGIERLKLAFTE